MILTHLYRMEFPTVINCNSPFLNVGCWVVFFIFIQILMEHSAAKQTVETLIRRRVVRRLIWVCTVCLCPTKMTLCVYWLKTGLTIYVHSFSPIARHINHVSPMFQRFLLTLEVQHVYSQTGLKHTGAKQSHLRKAGSIQDKSV